MARKEKGTHVNVSMKKLVHEKAKRIQADEKLATISDAIDKALDAYNKVLLIQSLKKH